MDRHGDRKPAAVPVEAKQTGEIQARWSWVGPRVWTERMLTALEQGVKGGWPNAFFAKQGLFSLPQPMQRPVSPLGGEPLTGEPCAGEPHARFGGRGPRVTGDPYPYQDNPDVFAHL